MRPITLFTGQWADLPFEDICALAQKMGYDGLELACWGNHLNVTKAAESDEYVNHIKATMAKHNLRLYAIGTHLIGQCVGDAPDQRLNGFAPSELKDKPEEIRTWAIEEMKKCAVAARRLGASVCTSFTGSPIWKYWYSFPQTTPEMVEFGFDEIYRLWKPIMDTFRENGIKYALEVHPTEIAFDYWSTKKLLDKFKDISEFGINFDPSHLLWQGVSPHIFLNDFIDRVYHVHIKDVTVNLDGRNGILGSHIEFGDFRRGWDFRSPGRGDVDFESIIRVLNHHGYQGPLSVEWEDSGMDRIHGATEAVEFLREICFPPSNIKFDDALKS
ncbi:MAG: sugar phosphate isomerase/epimerase [Defluviitaleaceae bacterium]|nr:sugar phosphate isomerase/epimerase [Defluviitaleaceae bacterium]